jgi:hypothetical protein
MIKKWRAFNPMKTFERQRLLPEPPFLKQFPRGILYISRAEEVKRNNRAAHKGQRSLKDILNCNSSCSMLIKAGFFIIIEREISIWDLQRTGSSNLKKEKPGS